jgi:hypothetical protein
LAKSTGLQYRGGTLVSAGAGNQRYFPSLCQQLVSMAALVNKSKYRKIRDSVVGSRFGYHRFVGL